MAKDIQATPEIIAWQVDGLAQPLAGLVARLRRHPPSLIMTCARGSSAHAATFGKHLIERYLSLPVAAAAPGIASVYERFLHLRNQLVLAISQSGRSDDLIAFAVNAKRSGALTVAITNDGGAPLAAACDIVLPIGAGPELSVAATKTFVATAAVLMRLTAAWADDARLLAALPRLPGRLAAAASLDWSGCAERLSRVTPPCRHRTRPDARDRPRSCAEAQGDLQSPHLHGPIALIGPGLSRRHVHANR